MNIKVYYEPLYGVSGYTFRSFIRNQWHYVMYIANDMDQKYLPQQIYNRQRFTIAHELGHVLLHNHLNDWNNLDPHQQNILEVEANWFASRLLMPDYSFQTLLDLSPEHLADKCQVNLQAAKKRLQNLDIQFVYNRIIKPVNELIHDSISPILPMEYDFDWYEYYDVVAASLDDKIGGIKDGSM